MHLFRFRVDNARVFQRVSMNFNITFAHKPHEDYCVDILNARWLRPVFAESCLLLRVNQVKKIVKSYVYYTLHVV